MDKKYSKLAVLGLIFFIIALAAVILFLPGNPRGPVGKGNYVVLRPLFVEQYLEENKGRPIFSSKPGTERVALATDGFSFNELAIGNAAGLTISNESGKLCSIIVTSDGLDGEKYEISRFVVAQGEEKLIGLYPTNLTKEIAELPETNLEVTDKGVFVFDVSSTNCGGENNYLAVYAKTD